MSIFVIIQLFVLMIYIKGELITDSCLSDGNTVSILKINNTNMIIYFYFKYMVKDV